MNKEIYFDKNFKKCFENAMLKGVLTTFDNWMYMYSDKKFDWFKNSLTRENRKVKK